jgi:hypothetical protein
VGVSFARAARAYARAIAAASCVCMAAAAPANAAARRTNARLIRAASAASQTRTAAGQALAQAALLERSDLGSGWVAAPPPKTIPSLTCPRFDPRVSGAVQLGAAASSTFQSSSDGPFVSQSAYAYATASEQAAVWRAVVRRNLLRCVAASLSQGSAQGVEFAVTSQRLLALAKLPVPAAGYRVGGTASTAGQTIGVFLDVLVLGRGRVVTEISISSFGAPASPQLEQRVARLVSQRLPTM